MALVTQSWGPQHVIVSQSTESPGAVVVAVSPPRGDSNSGRHYDPRNLQVGPMLAAPVSRESLAINDATKMTALQRTVQALGVGASADDGYWTPTTAAGEFGLLEAFHRKSAHRAAHGHSAPAAAVDALDAFVLVYGRPDEELRRNFSNHRGERVDLSLECFQLSRATLALRELEHLRDEAAVTGKAVKDGLRSTLPAMHQDSYYLVAYRDYSSFATRTFGRIAKRVRLGSPKYVEVHFAVRVGQSAGVFMPISAAQFMNGWELLNAARIAPGTAQRTDAEDSLQRWALTSEQFKSLGPLPGDLFAVESTATYSTAAAAGRAPQDVHVPSVWYRPGIQADPSPWDFSPAALQFRAQRYIERQYMAVGRLVVKGAIVVGGVLLIRYALQARNGDNGNSGRGRGGRSQRRDDRTVAEALFESAVEMNPLGFVRFMAGSST